MPNGDTELRGDEVTVLTEQGRIDQVRELCNGTAAAFASREPRGGAAAESGQEDPTVASTGG